MTRKYLLSAIVGFVGLVGCGDDAVPGTTDTDTETDTTDTTPSTMSSTMSTSIGTTDMTTDDPSTTTIEPTTSTTEPDDSSTTEEETTGPIGRPTDFLVRIENISDQTPLPVAFSPGVWVEHSVNAQPVFQFPNVAEPGNGLAELAEDGDPTALDAAMEDEAMVVQHGIFDTPEGGRPGPIQPGEAYEFTVSQAQPLNRLSIVLGMLGGNDVFLGTGPNGYGLFTGNGQPTAENNIARVMAFYETGTEANQPPGGGAYQGATQAAPNTGPDEAGVVSVRNESTRAVPFAPKLIDTEVTTDAMLGIVTIEIINVSDETFGGFVTPFSPVVYALHDDSVTPIALGDDATDTPGLEALAEDADPAALVATLDGTAGVSSAGSTANGLAPGESLTFTVIPDATNRFVTIAIGLPWTNDGFISTTAPIAIANENGTLRTTNAIEGDFDDAIAVLDAGTEVNESTGVAGPNNAANQENPGDGTPEGGTIAYYFDATNDLADLANFVDVSVTPTGPDSVELVITNVSDGESFQGSITGIVWAMHDGSYSAFTEGMAASPDLEDLAEDGITTGLIGDIEDSGFTTSGVAGPLAPGESITIPITTSGAEPNLSLFFNVSPSNDTFIALGPEGISLYDGNTLLDDTALATAVSGALGIWDAGTEGNQAGGGGAAMHGVGVGVVAGPPEGTLLLRQVSSDPTWAYPLPEQMVRVIVSPME